MKDFWRNALFVAGAFVVGGGAGSLYGAGPASVPSPRLPAEHWALPAKPDRGFAKADAAWKTQSPWSVVVTPPVVVEPAPFVPVGLIRTKGSYDVVFSQPYATEGEVRVRPGARLPDGGRVLGASRLLVRWVDKDGHPQARKLFTDPLVQTPPSGSIPPGAALPGATRTPSAIPPRTPVQPDAPSPVVPGVPLPPGMTSSGQ